LGHGGRGLVGVGGGRGEVGGAHESPCYGMSDATRARGGLAAVGLGVGCASVAACILRPPPVEAPPQNHETRPTGSEDAANASRPEARAVHITLQPCDDDRPLPEAKAEARSGPGGAVEARLAPVVIQQVVRSHFAEMRLCYEHGLARNGNLTLGLAVGRSPPTFRSSATLDRRYSTDGWPEPVLSHPSPAAACCLIPLWTLLARFAVSGTTGRCRLLRFSDSPY
jgi:hypothetical protein